MYYLMLFLPYLFLFYSFFPFPPPHFCVYVDVYMWTGTQAPTWRWHVDARCFPQQLSPFFWRQCLWMDLEFAHFRYTGWPGSSGDLPALFPQYRGYRCVPVGHPSSGLHVFAASILSELSLIPGLLFKSLLSFVPSFHPSFPLSLSPSSFPSFLKKDLIL